MQPSEVSYTYTMSETHPNNGVNFIRINRNISQSSKYHLTFDPNIIKTSSDRTLHFITIIYSRRINPESTRGSYAL